jgi:hypothetical protein
LLPAADDAAGLCYRPEQNYRTLLLGSTPVITKVFPQNVISVHGHVLLSVTKIEDRIAINAEILSKDARSVSIIKNNNWQINPNNLMSKKQSRF